MNPCLRITGTAPRFLTINRLLAPKACLLGILLGSCATAPSAGASQSTSALPATSQHPEVTKRELIQLQAIERLAETDLEAAVASLARAVNSQSSAPLDFALGRMLVRLGDVEAGLASLQQAGTKQPCYRQTWRTAGLVLANHDQHERALDMFANMLAIDPRDADALSLAGTSHAFLDQQASAERAYREALSVAPRSTEYRLGLVRSLHAQERFAEAAGALEELTKSASATGEVRLLQAQCHLAAADLDAAQHGLELVRSMDTQPADWPETCFSLAWAYRNSSDQASNSTHAADWMHVAAQAGLSAAQAEYARMLLDGHGRSNNPVEGAQWMKRAAQSGLASAQVNLGRLYLRGQGVPKNKTLAQHWIQSSAELGNSDAQRLLAMWRQSALGTPPEAR